MRTIKTLYDLSSDWLLRKWSIPNRSPYKWNPWCVRDCWLGVETLCFYRLRDYPSSLGVDEEGGWGYPPSEGRKVRSNGSGGYIERATCREVNKHGD